METADPGYNDEFENEAYEGDPDADDQDAGPATTPEELERGSEHDKAEG